MTIDDTSRNAFGFPSPLLSSSERRAFAVGNAVFRANWVAAPASAGAFDGLGPLFNARSCSSCHARDGRSRPPEPHEVDRHGLLVRIGIRSPDGPDRPHPAYGEQVQDVAVGGVRAEARVELRWRNQAGRYGDGTDYELIAPAYELHDAAYGPLGDDCVLGGRVAPQLIGLGLLEAIPEARLLALADPDDRDGDGISGRVHRLGDGGPQAAIGRFGWKATQPTVAAQTTAALLHDMGVTSPALPNEPLTAGQRALTASHPPEIDGVRLERLVFYTRTIAVPSARDRADAAVQAGAQRFAAFGCASCHVPESITGDDAFHPRFANQTIAPFTDLLLHDLGPELADEKRDGDALPGEWRTPPLWGIGLFEVVSGHTRYLHDGRARDLAEAVLWHGGEAAASRERFRLAPATQRSELLAFLRSL